MTFNGSAVRSSADNPISYRRGPFGDWLVAETVDPQDASIRVLLLTPDGPLYVRIEALINSRPFRAITEEWIDMALRDRSCCQNRGDWRSETRGDGGTCKIGRVGVSENECPGMAGAVRARFGGAGRTFRGPLADRTARRGSRVLELERFSSNRSAAPPLVQFLDADGDGAAGGGGRPGGSPARGMRLQSGRERGSRRARTRATA